MSDALQLISLFSDGQFHSGEALGRLLGISRAAVWKRLQQFQSSYGVQLESVRGRGYRLVGGIELLDEEKIRSGLSALARRWLTHFELHQTIGSTNRRASELVQQGILSGAVVIAEGQTAGSGRRGRRWVSPFGRNIYFSAVQTFEGGVGALEGLSLAVGLAVVKAIQPKIGTVPQLKWPNDVLVDAKKLAGILLEVAGEPDGRCTVVIGIGINVRMADVMGINVIEQPWTDVESQAGTAVSRNELVAELIERLVEVLDLFTREGFTAFRREWERLDYLRGREVVIESGGRVEIGTAVGLDHTGALLLETGGGIRTLHGGEVSVRVHA